jgi:hypothetical protein
VIAVGAGGRRVWETSVHCSGDLSLHLEAVPSYRRALTLRSGRVLLRSCSGEPLAGRIVKWTGAGAPSAKHEV